jgi:hypothetical protein
MFKKFPQMKAEMFVKYFFASEQNKVSKHIDLEDSEEEEYSPDDNFRRASIHSVSGRSVSVVSASKNRDISDKIRLIEDTIKLKLSANWVSVKKAFLDLD